MKPRFIFGLVLAALLFPSLLRLNADDDDDHYTLIDCGAGKVVLFKDAGSPGGRYAIGWTIRRIDPKAEPVNWTLWKDDPNDFLDKYNCFDARITGSGMAPLIDAAKSAPALSSDAKVKGPPYELLDCVVDLKKKELLPLHSKWPYWPRKNHGDFEVVWNRDDSGIDYAVVINEARFFTEDIWLISAGDPGMHASEVSHLLNKEASRILKSKRPLTYEAYAISWFNGDDAGKPTFSKNGVRFNFDADIPKMSYETVEGSMTLKLPECTIAKVDCTTQRDDPFLDNPELAKADKELNEVYAKLLGRLDKQQQETLRKEQRTWLANRDYASPPDSGSHLSASVVAFHSDHLSPVPTDEDNYTSFNENRDESLIKSTEKRTEELRKRLRQK